MDDLDALERVARAAQVAAENDLAGLSTRWFDPAALSASLAEEDAAFVAALSPAITLRLIARLRAAEAVCEAAHVLSEACIEMDPDGPELPTPGEIAPHHELLALSKALMAHREALAAWRTTTNRGDDDAQG